MKWQEVAVLIQERLNRETRGPAVLSLWNLDLLIFKVDCASSRISHDQASQRVALYAADYASVYEDELPFTVAVNGDKCLHFKLGGEG